jgi:hypothetical protein
VVRFPRRSGAHQVPFTAIVECGRRERYHTHGAEQIWLRIRVVQDQVEPDRLALRASAGSLSTNFAARRPDWRFGFRLKNVSDSNVPFTHMRQSRPRCVICRSPNVRCWVNPASRPPGWR